MTSATKPKKPTATKPYSGHPVHHWLSDGDLKCFVVCFSFLVAIVVVLFFLFVLYPVIQKIVNDLTAQELLKELIHLKNFVTGGGFGFAAGLTLGITGTNIWHRMVPKAP